MVPRLCLGYATNSPAKARERDYKLETSGGSAQELGVAAEGVAYLAKDLLHGGSLARSTTLKLDFDRVLEAFAKKCPIFAIRLKVVLRLDGLWLELVVPLPFH